MEKLHHIDVAKGMLILMVIVGHMNNVADRFSLIDCYNNLIGGAEQFWGPFFMAAFFVITGFCSNFEKKFKLFFLSNIKSIMVPAYIYAIVYQLVVTILSDNVSVFVITKSIARILLFGSVPWFLSALFVDKVIFFFLQKIKCFPVVLIVSISMSFIGLFLWNMYDLPRFWNFQHAMILLPFLAFGSWLKGKQECMNLIFLAGMFLVPWLILLLLDVPVPLMSNAPRISLWLFPIWLYLALTGSLFTLTFCAKVMPKNTVIEFFGRNSLVFYVLHYNFLELYFSIISNTPISSVFKWIFVLLFSLLSTSICSFLLNQKYAKILIGRW